MVPIQLSPAQQRALDALNTAIDRNDVVELRSAGGMGRTAVLRRLHQERGGALLDMRAVMDDMQQSDPLALEETVYRRLVAELSQHPLVILDDVQWLMHVVIGCGSSDLKRVVEDAKVLFVYDRARGIAPRPAIEYFTEAANTVRDNGERYARAEAKARAARPNRPQIFDIPGAMFAHAIALSDGAMGSGS